MTWRRAAMWIAAFAALAVVGSCGGVDRLGAGSVHTGETGGDTIRPGARLEATVVRVVDGDTIVVRIDGRREKVRYIGIDTPETKKPGTPVQCFGKAASHENERLVDRAAVRLEIDAEPRDRYGRLLAYVYRRRDNLMINEALVRGGYAVTLTIPPNVRFADRFARLARAARQAGKGLWSRC